MLTLETSGDEDVLVARDLVPVGSAHLLQAIVEQLLDCFFELGSLLLQHVAAGCHSPPRPRRFTSSKWPVVVGVEGAREWCVVCARWDGGW